MIPVKADTLVDRIVHVLHDHLNLLEEVRRGIALSRATRGIVINEVVENLHRLRLSRGRLLEELKAITKLEDLSESESEDLIALLGYYVEVAYANELSILLDIRDLVNVNSDLGDLEDLRREAKAILSSLFNKSTYKGQKRLLGLLD